MGDYDDDGDLDLFVTDTDRSSLYRNDSRPGELALEDVTVPAGLARAGYQWTGAAFADVDNDGLQDLFVGNFFSANILYRNQGDGTFDEVTAEAGVGNEVGTTAGLAFGDADNDGDLDLIVANYYLRFSEPASVLNVLYRNDGDGRFTDVSAGEGIRTQGRSFQPSFLDYDEDGDADIYIVNDFGPNELHRNDGNGHFTDVSVVSGSDDDGSGMGCAVADYDGDGDLDIYVANFGNNSLLRNEGDGSFANVAGPARVNNVFITWGTEFFDFDNDGDLDLFNANGGMEWNYHMRSYAYAPNALYSNDGSGTYHDVTVQLGTADTHGARGLAVGDLDGDGFPDVLLLNIDHPSLLYLNRGNGNHWLKVRPVGTRSNRDGIGAKVRIVVDGRSQYQEVRCGNSFLSQSSREADFGVGDATLVDMVEIRWPASGIVDRLRDVAVDRVLTVTEGSAATAVAPVAPVMPVATALAQNYPNPFNGQTRIRFHIGPGAGAGAGSAPVRLDLYNAAGQRIRRLVDRRLPPGQHQVDWDGRDRTGRSVPSGVYFMRLRYAGTTQTRPLAVLQ